MSDRVVTSRQGREEKAFFWGVMIPLGLLALGLKVWRIIDRAQLGAWWSPVDLLRSDVMILLGFGALGYGALRLGRSNGQRVMILGVLQVVALFWAFFEVAAHQFYIATGSILDLHLLFYAFGRVDEILELVASEVPAGYWAFFALVISTFLLSPWLWRIFLKPSTLAHPRKPLVLAGAGAFCIVLAALPPFGKEYTEFGRATAMNLALSLRSAYWMDVADQQRESLRGLEIVGGPEKPKNLVILILESTRARSMTVYNPELETTPFLASLAKESLVAERAYAVVPHTSKALVSILCGVEPRLRMPITEAEPEGIPARCLADLLGDMGYRTLFMQSATQRFENRPGLTENMGYQDFIPLEDMESAGFEKANYFGQEDAVMLGPSRKWLEKNKDSPFFITYLTLTPHHDYLAPRRRFGRFEYVEDDELNRYLNTIHYVDQFARELLEQYRELGVFEDTVFVFVGDHGEGFGEHGRSQHDNVIWEEGLHVPLMIYDPSKPEGIRVSAPVSQLDIAPTLLDWLGIEVEGGDYPGQVIREIDEDRRVFAHCWFERRCMASVGARYKVIEHFGRSPAEVYDLIEDPLETNNLVRQKGEELRRAQTELFGWRGAVNQLYRAEGRERIAQNLLKELPESARSLDFQIGDYVQFRGYELESEQALRGRPFRVTYYFEALKPIPEGWQLFVHGEGAGPMLNLDHIPVQGLYPLDEWQVGEIIADRHTIRVPRDRSPGRLRVYLGVYHKEEGRLPIWGDVEVDSNRRAKIFEVPLR